MNCKNCGERMHGDGVRDVLHCERVDLGTVWETEPDAEPLHCSVEETTEILSGCAAST